MVGDSAICRLCTRLFELRSVTVLCSCSDVWLDTLLNLWSLILHCGMCKFLSHIFVCLCGLWSVVGGSAICGLSLAFCMVACFRLSACNSHCFSWLHTMSRFFKNEAVEVWSCGRRFCDLWIVQIGDYLVFMFGRLVRYAPELVVIDSALWHVLQRFLD